MKCECAQLVQGVSQRTPGMVVGVCSRESVRYRHIVVTEHSQQCAHVAVVRTYEFIVPMG